MAGSDKGLALTSEAGPERMQTNYAGFALAVGMGLIVVLLGLLGLSAAGLTNLAPGLAAETEAAAPDSLAATGPVAAPVSHFVAATPAEAEAIAAGDALFKNNCAQCHAVNEKVVGPALAGLGKRRPAGWIVRWVQNSAKVIASGDEYAVKLFDDNGKQQMPAFPQLSDKDIRAIVAWIGSQEGTDAPVVGAATVVAAR